MITSDIYNKANFSRNFLISIDDFLENQDGIFLPPRNSSINYNDGDASETKIYETLKNTDDKSVFSTELQESIVDWPSEYHFSPNRSLLLRHLPINKGDEVLELGSGCGAITRYLCETGCIVTAVEGSPRRAIITKERCKGFSDLSVYAANFDEVGFVKKYDWVLLIGVLEYSGIYSHSDNPYSSLLLKVKSLLKPNGKIVIAIENKLGLKYFGGCGEDHISKKFFGIENRYTSKTARTFGKDELTAIISDSGYKKVRFQYPFPDYKLPEVIITNEGIECKDFLSYELIRFLKSRDYARNVHTEFDETLVWPQLWRNNLLQDFSNSFLVIAEKESDDTFKDDLLAITYNLYKNPTYSFSRCYKTSKNNICIETKHLINKIDDKSPQFSIETGSSAYINAPSIHSKIIESISKNDSVSIEKYVSIWFDTILEKTKSSHFNLLDTLYVSGNFFDLNPKNILLTNFNSVAINDNCNVNFEIPISVILLRYLRRNLYCGDKIEIHYDHNPLKYFLDKFASHFYTPVTRSDFFIEELFNDIITSYLNHITSDPFQNNNNNKQIIQSIIDKYDKNNDIFDKIKFLISCSLIYKDWKLAYEAAMAASFDISNHHLIELIKEYIMKFSFGKKEAIESYEYIEIKQLTNEYLKNNNPESAINTILSFVDKYNNHAHAHNDLGILYYNTGSADKALIEYEKAVSIDSDNSIFLKNLADLYCLEYQRIDEAKLLYIGVLKMHPNDVEAKRAMDYIAYKYPYKPSISIEKLTTI